jgi:hypothetical protein
MGEKQFQHTVPTADTNPRLDKAALARLRKTYLPEPQDGPLPDEFQPAEDEYPLMVAPQIFSALLAVAEENVRLEALDYPATIEILKSRLVEARARAEEAKQYADARIAELEELAQEKHERAEQLEADLRDAESRADDGVAWRVRAERLKTALRGWAANEDLFEDLSKPQTPHSESEWDDRAFNRGLVTAQERLAVLIDQALATPAAPYVEAQLQRYHGIEPSHRDDPEAGAQQNDPKQDDAHWYRDRHPEKFPEAGAQEKG